MPEFEVFSLLIGFALACIACGLLFEIAVPLVSAPEEPEGITFCYWRRGVPVPQGWEIVDDFAGTHHGEYAVLLRKGKDDGRSNPSC